MAFGTGTHPSTQLCMQLLENHARSGEPFIDIGCGSGILSITAIRLGASRAVAVDIDRAAIIGTRENAEINGVQEQIEVAEGSVANFLEGEFSLRQAPLVAANILAPVILRLFEDNLADLVAPGGTLLLSGILAEQTDKIRQAAAAKELRFIEMQQTNDWVALAFQAQS
jgi:ribosomal protein L11 methyltransferase